MQNKNNKPEEQILVIFGATGDLSKRKLMPALYALNVLDMLLPDMLKWSNPFLLIKTTFHGLIL